MRVRSAGRACSRGFAAVCWRARDWDACLLWLPPLRRFGSRSSASSTSVSYTHLDVYKRQEEGRVTFSGAPVKKNRRTECGEAYTVELPEPELPEPEPQNIPLDIVYEDSDVIVVNKPRGMVVHPAPGHPDGTLVNALLWHCGDSPVSYTHLEDAIAEGANMVRVGSAIFGARDYGKGR